MSRRRIQVVGAVILQDEKVLIVQRAAHDTGGGLWEFPGGKIEAGESPEQALIREIEEELALQVRVLEDLGSHFHAYPQVDIDMRLFFAEILSGHMRLHEHSAFEWLHPSQIDPGRLLEADQPFLERILSSPLWRSRTKGPS